MKPAPCPLPLEPRLLAKPWGGRRLEAWDKILPPGAPVGESWELFDDEAGSSVVAEGPARGRTLRDLASLWGRGLYGDGPKALPASFPLLVKLLDARENLSVQVHPDDALARELHGPKAQGKSEAWVVLETGPGRLLYNGFKPGTAWADVERALAAGRVADLMNAVQVKPGDVVDVPTGRPHALGAGCLVAEIQQNSDHTYRLWDWGRLDRGKPRSLHLAEARRALRFDAVGCGDGRVEPRPVPEAWGTREFLISNAHFALERWTLKAGAGPSGVGPLWILLPVSGAASLRWRGLGRGQGLDLRPGVATLLPAGLALELRAGPSGAVVLCACPNWGTAREFSREEPA